jgi:hypothetical protein
VTRSALVSILILGGCGGGGGGQEDAPGPPPVFPADYLSTYQEVRNCRGSIEHGAVRIRVLASPDAVTPYVDRAAPFPVGAILLKEERDDSDLDCTGPIVNFTVMQQLAAGTDPVNLDWTWQEVDPQLHVRATDIKRCSQCHASCVPPDGYEHTCTVP